MRGELGREAGAAAGALPPPRAVGVRRTGALDPRDELLDAALDAGCENVGADTAEPRPAVAPGPLRRTTPGLESNELPARETLLDAGKELLAREDGALPAEPTDAARCFFTRAFALAVVLFFENISARASCAPRFFGTTESGTPASFIDGPFGRWIAPVPPLDALEESAALWSTFVAVGLAAL